LDGASRLEFHLTGLISLHCMCPMPQMRLQSLDLLRCQNGHQTLNAGHSRFCQEAAEFVCGRLMIDRPIWQTIPWSSFCPIRGLFWIPDKNGNICRMGLSMSLAALGSNRLHRNCLFLVFGQVHAFATSDVLLQLCSWLLFESMLHE